MQKKSLIGSILKMTEYLVRENQKTGYSVAASLTSFLVHSSNEKSYSFIFIS